MSSKVKAGIKRRDEESEETTREMQGTKLQNISDGIASNLPSLETLCRYVHYSRQDRNIPPRSQRRHC